MNDPLPGRELLRYAEQLKPRSRVLDAGCGEGKNAIFLAEQGHIVDAFSISAAGIAGAKRRAAERRLDIRFWLEDMSGFGFRRKYDAILSYDTLHMPEKAGRDSFLRLAREHTKPGGLHFIGVFTNRLPPAAYAFSKSLFAAGELPAQYAGWDIVHHAQGVQEDQLLGGAAYECSYERIVARKPIFRHITENKRDFLPLLMLSGKEEREIGRCLDRGGLFALYLGEELVGAGVVTREEDDVLELQAIAVTECRRRQRWGVQLVKFLLGHYRGKGKTMLVGTGNESEAVQFYRHCGFHVSGYDYADGDSSRCKVYLAIDLGG